MPRIMPYFPGEKEISGPGLDPPGELVNPCRVPPAPIYAAIPLSASTCAQPWAACQQSGMHPKQTLAFRLSGKQKQSLSGVLSGILSLFPVGRNP